MRHVAGWNLEEIIQEYRSFADIKARDCDIKYITEYDVSKLAGLFSRIPTPALALTSAKMQKLLVITMSALYVQIPTLNCSVFMTAPALGAVSGAASVCHSGCCS
jgi:tyrosine-protein phosphatase SIW14